MILWAPALSIGEEGNLAKWRKTQLKKAETATDITIGKNKLRETTTTTKIIHGKQDQVVPIEKLAKTTTKNAKMRLKKKYQKQDTHTKRRKNK